MGQERLPSVRDENRCVCVCVCPFYLEVFFNENTKIIKKLLIGKKKRALNKIQSTENIIFGMFVTQGSHAYYIYISLCVCYV